MKGALCRAAAGDLAEVRRSETYVLAEEVRLAGKGGLAPPAAPVVLFEGGGEPLPFLPIVNDLGHAADEFVEVGILIGAAASGLVFRGETRGRIPVDCIDGESEFLGGCHERLLLCPAGRKSRERRESRLAGFATAQRQGP